MTVESDVADMYELLLRKGATEKTAREVAMAFYRQLAPSSDDFAAREAVSRAIATVRIASAASNDSTGRHRRLKGAGG